MQWCPRHFIDQKSMWVMKTTDAAAISPPPLVMCFNGMGKPIKAHPWTLGLRIETYIIVLNWHRKIYLNGILLTRGRKTTM